MRQFLPAFFRRRDLLAAHSMNSEITRSQNTNFVIQGHGSADVFAPNWDELDLSDLADQIVSINAKHVHGEVISGFGMKDKTRAFLDLIRSAMFPNIYDTHIVREQHYHTVAVHKFGEAAVLLDCMISELLVNDCELRTQSDDCRRCKQRARHMTIEFMKTLPEIARRLDTDIVAAYNGDPAAMSSEEILLAYPGFDAVSVYRLAHEIYRLRVPMLARVMTEIAHSRTGIDIHPGATIGDYFFIDHGTGVVIGETCVIGNHVKLYQGVTLGARSFELDDDGNPVKGVKRHPDIEDNVVIYAGATILGGDTRIGHNSTIGGNTWLTHSVPPNSLVYNAAPAPVIKSDAQVAVTGGEVEKDK